jgi:hypothetical protein
MAKSGGPARRKRAPAKAASPAQTSASPDQAPDAVERRAYELFLDRGAEPGHELDDWLRAERELKDRRGG